MKTAQLLFVTVVLSLWMATPAKAANEIITMTNISAVWSGVDSQGRLTMSFNGIDGSPYERSINVYVEAHEFALMQSCRDLAVKFTERTARGTPAGYLYFRLYTAGGPNASNAGATMPLKLRTCGIAK